MKTIEIEMATRGRTPYYIRRCFYISKDFSTIINNYIKKHHITKTQFAKLIKISPRTLKAWLDGDGRNIKIIHITRLEQVIHRKMMKVLN